MNRVTIFHTQRLEPGTCDDDPYTLFFVAEHDSGQCGWIAGPHGTSCCAIDDWFQWYRRPAATQSAALRSGIDFSLLPLGE